MAKKPASNSKKPQTAAKPPALRSFSKGGSALVDTRVIYCGDNLEQLKKLSRKCVDLIYIDPPFNSNRNYEVFWGETKEKRAFDDRHASTQAYIDFMRPRCVELHRVLKKTGSFYYHCDWHASHYVKIMLDQIFDENNFSNAGCIVKSAFMAHVKIQNYPRRDDYLAKDEIFHRPKKQSIPQNYLKPLRGPINRHNSEENVLSMSPYRNWFIAGAAAICFVTGLTLSHRIEPGVRVQNVTLAEDTPALKFIPTGAGPHPVALLAHGYAGSKETLFRYGEALAAAGFICYDVDLPGHGASTRTYTYMEAVHTLEAVAREVGPVDVFAGHSLGYITGGEAVREGGMKPGLFIAIGSIMPVLGDHAPPLLILAGRFEEFLPPALLKTRTDVRLVISPWSDHLLEGFDPVLVNAAVEAACAAVNKTPPPPPTAWRWRLLGAALAMLAAGKLASCLTDLFLQLARFRGLFIGVFIAVAFMLTLGGRWLDATPHLRLQGIAMPVIFLLAMIAGRLRIPRWSFAALGILVVVIAVCWLKVSPSVTVWVFVACAVVFTPALIAGVVIGWVAARRGSRLQGDIAMAIFVGFAAFQCMEPPRTAPEVPQPHDIIKLDAKLLDACIGEYEIAPDNVFFTGTKVTIRRNGDHLVWQAFGEIPLPGALDLYPESETNFFLKINGAQVTFIKNEKGEVTAIIHHKAGLPDSEGKKLTN